MVVCMMNCTWTRQKENTNSKRRNENAQWIIKLFVLEKLLVSFRCRIILLHKEQDYRVCYTVSVFFVKNVILRQINLVSEMMVMI